MALPKLDLPISEIELPASKRKIKIRPFTVKEEKILLIASQSGEVNDVVNAIVQIVNNCLVDDIDVYSLSLVDLQYIFIQLRIVSVGNKQKIILTDPEDSEQYELEVDLNQIKVVYPKNQVDKVIMLTDSIGVTMKYATFEMVKEAENLKIEDIIINCIENIFDQNEVYDVKEQTKDELYEFVGSLTNEQANKMRLFLESVPTLTYNAEYTNMQGELKTYEVTNINDFF